MDVDPNEGPTPPADTDKLSADVSLQASPELRVADPGRDGSSCATAPAAHAESASSLPPPSSPANPSPASSHSSPSPPVHSSQPLSAAGDVAASVPENFSVLWSELERYVAKRFGGELHRLSPLSEMLRRLRRQRLRVEELAFLVGHSFPEHPDVSLCLSLFLPDRTLIHAGNPAAAMCSLIQHMAPDKYVIFNSILKSCMAQKTQRGSRDTLLHRMQLLFKGHPLVIRAIRKLLVQQFCIEKNGGVVRQEQVIEYAKPFDSEPLQLHSACKLAYQVGLSSGCSEKAKSLSSIILQLSRLYLSNRVSFTVFGSEVDRVFRAYPKWMHVANDIKVLVVAVTPEDEKHAKDAATRVKLLAARSPAGCCSSPSSLMHLCDLFLHGLASTSVSLRLEFDHLLRKAAQGLISIPLAAYRVASLLQQHPECSDKLGVLFRIFRDMKLQRQTITKQEKRPLESQTKPDVCRREPEIRSENSDERQTSAQKRRRLEQENQMCVDPSVSVSGDTGEFSLIDCNSQNVLHLQSVGAAPTLNLEGGTGSISSPSSNGNNGDLAAEAAELVRRYLIPCRRDSLIVFLELLKFDWFDIVYPIVERYRAGVMSSQQLLTSFQSLLPDGLPSLIRFCGYLNIRKDFATNQKPFIFQREVLSKQQYDQLPRNGSYRRLPDDLTPATRGGADELCLQVLNDRWALFPDSSESQARCMNRHEEALLSIADSRYQWDLRVSTLESCIKRVESVAEALVMLDASLRPFAAVRPSLFSQNHVACLRKVFGAHTEQVLSHLCAAPLQSLETIYSTLEFKLQQWKAVQLLLSAYWKQLELPHFAGAIDFKKRYPQEKKTGEDDFVRIDVRKGRGRADNS